MVIRLFDFEILEQDFHCLAWDQSDKFVKIYVQNLDGVGDLPSEQIRCSFENS